jgi:outer membrane biosynthesis protein TonB
VGTRRRNSILPAAAFSVAAHAALFAFVILSWPKEVKHLTMGAVPVTLISTRPEEAAPAPPTPDPAPEPTPQPVETPPTPEPPKPAPPKPTPPKPAQPKPVPPKVEPPKPAQAKTVPTAAAPAKAPPARSKPAPPERSIFDEVADAPPTPSHAAGAPKRAAPGAGHAAATAGPELGALAAKITQFWHPNCQSPGADQVDIDISVRLSPQGRLLGEPKIENPKANDPIWQAAADRAVGAAKVARYSELPPDQLRLLADEGKITLKLHSRVACAR